MIFHYTSFTNLLDQLDPHRAGCVIPGLASNAERINQGVPIAPPMWAGIMYSIRLAHLWALRDKPATDRRRP